MRGRILQRQRRLLPEAKPIAARRIETPAPSPPIARLPIIPSLPTSSSPIGPVRIRQRQTVFTGVGKVGQLERNLFADINRGAVPVRITKPTLENALDEEVPPGEPGGDPETDLLRVISRQGSAVLGGDPSRTISSQLGQRQLEGRAGIVTNSICAGLNVVDRDHCIRAFRSEQQRTGALSPGGRPGVGIPTGSSSSNFIGWTPAYGRRIASEIRRGRISCR